MRYLIIGLGIYGTNLAIELTQKGHEVIGADINPTVVEAIKEYISTAYIVDASDEVALSMLPLKNVDIVIVAIGENFGASIRTVAMLKKMGIEHIYARAIDKIHEAILRNFNLDRIVTPEQRAACDLANEMSLDTHVSSIKIADKGYVLNFKAPKALVGENYSTLKLSRRYGVKLVAATRLLQKQSIINTTCYERTFIDITNPDLTVEPDDMFCCIGLSKDFNALFKYIDEKN